MDSKTSILRVRPLEIRPKPAKNPKAKPRGRPQALSPKGGKSRSNKACLVVNDSSSVAISAPPSVFDSKRNKSELYDGFSFVFPSESAQLTRYLRDYLEGKKCMTLEVRSRLTEVGRGRSHGSMSLVRLLTSTSNELLTKEREHEEYLFEILKSDLRERLVKPLKMGNLSDCMLFLGLNQLISLTIGKCRACRANCICLAGHYQECDLWLHGGRQQ